MSLSLSRKNQLKVGQRRSGGLYALGRRMLQFDPAQRCTAQEVQDAFRRYMTACSHWTLYLPDPHMVGIGSSTVKQRLVKQTLYLCIDYLYGLYYCVRHGVPC